MQSSNMEVDWIEAEMIHLTPDVASTVAQINNWLPHRISRPASEEETFFFMATQHASTLIQPRIMWSLSTCVGALAAQVEARKFGIK